MIRCNILIADINFVIFKNNKKIIVSFPIWLKKELIYWKEITEEYKYEVEDDIKWNYYDLSKRFEEE